MYILTKKFIIIILFLISIILMIEIQNIKYNDQQLNIMLVSNEDTKDYNLTKIIWDTMSDLEINPQLIKNYSQINNKYLEVDDPQNFTNSVEQNIKDKDIIIFVNDIYDEFLPSIIEKYPDKKFVMINNENTYNQTNAYKISISWNDIFSKLKEQLDQIASSKLSKDNYVKIGYVTTDSKHDTTLYKEFQNVIKNDKKIQMYPIILNGEDTDDLSEHLSDAYNNDVDYYFSPDFSLQADIITSLVELQKTNVYNANKNISDTSKNNDDKKNRENNYLPIKYFSLYNEDPRLGQYDDVLQDPVEKENIIYNEFNLNFSHYLIKIYLDKDGKSDNYRLTFKNKGLSTYKVTNKEENV